MKATLTYHSIDDSESPVSVPVPAFDAHMRWLAGGAVRTLPLDQLVTGGSDAGDAVAVTFDDACANAKPTIGRLLDHGILPTIFVVTGHVGRTNAGGGAEPRGIPTLPLMTWTDLEELVSRGARVEAHSRTHPRLTGLSAAQMDDELAGSREDLRHRLGVTSRHVAYPYGAVDAAVVARDWTCT